MLAYLCKIFFHVIALGFWHIRMFAKKIGTIIDFVVHYYKYIVRGIVLRHLRSRILFYFFHIGNKQKV